MSSRSAVNGQPSPEIDAEIANLHERYSGSLLRYASSLAEDAESARDALQEAFLRYVIERSYGRKIDNPRAWLYQVLRNYLLDRRKSAAALTEVGCDCLAGVPDPSHDPEDRVARSEIARTIAAALSQRELECLELRAEGLSYEEIGVAMDIRIGTVGALLSRALEKIRRLRKGGAFGLGPAADGDRLAPRGTACTRS